MEKITFVKTPYDSLLGEGFTPMTYHYSIPWVTNGALRSLTVTRTVPRPDIIFTAGDITFAPVRPVQRTLVRSVVLSPLARRVSVGGSNPMAT